MEIGLISDTHGLVRPEALDALVGASLIVHAGDVGKPEVLEALERVAPVVAVRGNNDHGPWAERLPLERHVHLGKGAGELLVTHERTDVAENALPARVRVVVTGHSHEPGQDRRDGVLFINPGSAGPRRFRLPICVARLSVDGTGLRARVVELDVAPPTGAARHR